MKVLLSCLSNRTRRFKKGGDISDPWQLFSGSPQGSVLVFLPFFLYNDNMLELPPFSKGFCFVGDTKLIVSVEPVHENAQKHFVVLNSW